MIQNQAAINSPASPTKMLRSSLKELPGALEALEILGIDSARRAETVSVDDFVKVARELGARAGR